LKESFVDWEKAQVERLEGEGYSRGYAEELIEGGPLEAGDGGGEDAVGAAP